MIINTIVDRVWNPFRWHYFQPIEDRSCNLDIMFAMVFEKLFSL